MVLLALRCNHNVSNMSDTELPGQSMRPNKKNECVLGKGSENFE